MDTPAAHRPDQFAGQVRRASIQRVADSESSTSIGMIEAPFDPADRRSGSSSTIDANNRRPWGHRPYPDSLLMWTAALSKFSALPQKNAICAAR